MNTETYAKILSNYTAAFQAKNPQVSGAALSPEVLAIQLQIDPNGDELVGIAQAASRNLYAWPKLEGSEKQITWAETIRRTLLAPGNVTAVLDLCKQFDTQERKSLAYIVFKSVCNETSAKVWIDQRDKDLRTITGLAIKSKFASSDIH